MRRLTVGDKGVDVYFAQRLFDDIAVTNGLKNYLEQDGDFGPKTKTAIIEFQTWYRSKHGPVVPLDGAIGTETWSALGAAAAIEHTVPMVPQQNSTTCWLACIRMLLGAATSTTVPASALNADGTLKADGPARTALATALGRRVIDAPRTLRGLYAALERRPGVLLGDCIGYATGRHAVVASGFYVDTALSSDLSVLRLHNPSPIGKGRIERASYPDIVLEKSYNFTPTHLIV